MSKISEQKALEVYPKDKLTAVEAVNRTKRFGYIQGYDQAMQDFIEKAERWLNINFHEHRINDMVYSDEFATMGTMIEQFKNYMKNEEM